MSDNDSIIPIYELDKDGKPGGLIEYDIRDEDQLLGVFLKFQFINDDLVGKFFTPSLPTKIALIEMDVPRWILPGALIKYSRKEYIEKMETLKDGQYPNISFKYLDHSPFYQRIRTNVITKRFWTKIVISDKTEFKSTGKEGYLCFDHFLFGRVLLNSDIKDACQQSYQSVLVEGSIRSDSPLLVYDNMSFTVNFNADDESPTVAENSR